MATYDFSQFSKVVKKKIEGYQFDIGILEDSPLKRAKYGSRKKLYGGDARKVAGNSSSDWGMQKLGGHLQLMYSWLWKPFHSEKNQEILKFAKVYIKEINKDEVNVKRLENLVQAIVRNPILRGDYGHNSEKAIKSKRFDRLMIDTGKFFNSIKAKLIKVGA